MGEGWISIEGRRIFYREQGEGKPVLLIHGNIASGLWYTRAMSVPGLRCIAPDLPNFGHSDPIEGCEIERYADFTLGILETLGVKTATVVGHSLGGAVAMAMAIRKPNQVDRLLLVDSAPVDGLTTPEDHYPAIELFRTNRALLSQALRAVVPHLSDEKLFEELVDEAGRMAAHAFVGNARALERYDYSTAAARYPGPVLSLVGAEDLLIDEAATRRSASRFPRSEVRVLPDVGHSVIVEDPALFKGILESFAKG